MGRFIKVACIRVSWLSQRCVSFPKIESSFQSFWWLKPPFNLRLRFKFKGKLIHGKGIQPLIHSNSMEAFCKEGNILQWGYIYCTWIVIYISFPFKKIGRGDGSEDETSPNWMKCCSFYLWPVNDCFLVHTMQYFFLMILYIS